MGRAYAFFADMVRGVSQAFRRYLCRISNPNMFFLNFNGDFMAIGTAQKRSVERLINAQARCQLWGLGSTVSFVAGACGAEEHG
jgi:hypothetical protein